MDESSKLESSDESDREKYYKEDRILCVSSFPWAAQEEVLTVCERQTVFKSSSPPPPWLFLMEPVFESSRSLCTVAQPQGSLAVSEGRILWCLAKFLGVTG